MMKKTLLAILILSLFSSVLFAQSLKDNPDYRKSVELKKQSEVAFEEGDYTEAKRLAEESLKHAALSDEWIAMMLSRYKANSALRRFEKALNSAANIQGEQNFPEEYAQGKELYAQAYNEFRSELYEESYESSIKGLEALSSIVYIRPSGQFPAYYVVRDLPGTEDCLWIIAAQDFIYGNPLLWEMIYEANKDLLQDPSNPDLIQPGMILEIPERQGENRNGTWENGVIR